MTKKGFLILALILFSNLVLRFYRLDYSFDPIFDEKAYYLDAARSYLENRDDPNLEHPPLGKELIALGIKIFGDNPHGWRALSVIFSLVGLALIYLLAGEIFGGFFVPLVSSLLLSVDNMFLIHSRLAVPEIFLMVFILSTFFFLWRYFKKGGALNLLLLAVSFGLGLATKWTALLIFPAVWFFLYLRDGFGKKFLVNLLVFLLLTTAIYTVAYLPYILRNSFWQYLSLQQTIVNFWLYFSRKVRYSGFVSFFLSHSVSWLFDPAWGYDYRLVNEKRIGIVSALFNPALFWLSIFYVVKTFRNLRPAFDLRMVFILLPILLNFFPWFLVWRNQYLYYLLFSLPFLCLLTAAHLRKLFDSGLEGRYRTVWLIATIVAVFVYFYPLSTSLPVGKFYLSPFYRGPLTLTYVEIPKKTVTLTLK